MFRWFLGTLGVLVIFGFLFAGGYYVGNLECSNKALKDNNVVLQEQVKDAKNEGNVQLQLERERQENEKVLQEQLKQLASRRVDYAAEFRRALSSSDLHLCVYDDGVRRVRSVPYENARRAAAEVNRQVEDSKDQLSSPETPSS